MSRPTRGGEDASRRVSVKVSVLLLHPHLLLWLRLAQGKRCRWFLHPDRGPKRRPEPSRVRPGRSAGAIGPERKTSAAAREGSDRRKTSAAARDRSDRRKTSAAARDRSDRRGKRPRRLAECSSRRRESVATRASSDREVHPPAPGRVGASSPFPAAGMANPGSGGWADPGRARSATRECEPIVVPLGEAIDPWVGRVEGSRAAASAGVHSVFKERCAGKEPAG